MSTVVSENENVMWDPDSSLGVSCSYCSTEAPVTVPFSQTNHCQIHTRVTVRDRETNLSVAASPRKTKIISWLLWRSSPHPLEKES